jgi:hypothetical protein
MGEISSKSAKDQRKANLPCIDREEQGKRIVARRLGGVLTPSWSDADHNQRAMVKKGGEQIRQGRRNHQRILWHWFFQGLRETVDDLWPKLRRFAGRIRATLGG